MEGAENLKSNLTDEDYDNFTGESSCVESTNVLGPLTFPQKLSKQTVDPENEEDALVSCLLCNEEFQLLSDQNSFLQHLFITHRLVIADVHTVASLKSYVDFWRVRFRGGPLEEFCTSMLMDVLPDGTPSPGERYFLLSDVLPEDRLLREGLQEKRLKWVLERQQFEREDRNFSLGCLFCKQRLEGSRADALHHLSDKHGLQLGRPDNLVFVDELLQRIQTRLEQLRCLFCGNTFPDRPTLKEHMRKKQHKAINPNETEYDRFFIINYLELGKSWREVEKERDEPTATEEESWSDWCEEGEGSLTCLYCTYQANSLQALNCHSQVQHGGFSLDNLSLSFYLQVKMVNFIRRQMHLLHCPVCDESFADHALLIHHLTVQDHFKVPDQTLFDQPQYFFPTYEDDAVLCHLEDNDENEESEAPVQV